MSRATIPHTIGRRTSYGARRSARPMLARLLVAVLVLTSLAPSAAAALPAAGVGSDVVTSHHAYDLSTGLFCTSRDAFTGIVTSDLTSRFSAMPAGPGLTTFTLQLDATLADPVNGVEACDGADLTFTSDIAWPLSSGWNVGSFSATCGLSGAIYAYRSTLSDDFQIHIGEAPEECALPLAQGFLGWSMTPVHPATAAVCSPLLVPACLGAYDSTYPGYGCSSGEASRFVLTAVLDVVSVERSCHYWSDQREHVVVSDGLGIVRIDTTSDSCTIRVGDPLGVAPSQSTACPAELGDAIYGTDWTHLLP